MHCLPSIAFWTIFFAICCTQVAGLGWDPMVVGKTAGYCRPLEAVKNNGYHPTWKKFPIPRVAARSDQDSRPRWSVRLPVLQGKFTILQAVRDARGNLQHHLKIHAYRHNWTGYLVIRASYVAAKKGPYVEHLYAYDLEDAAGCILTTQSAYPLYNIDWSFQLTGHPTGREP